MTDFQSNRFTGFSNFPSSKKKNWRNLKKKLSGESTKFKLKNELLCDSIALSETEINGSEAVFLGRI